MNHGSANESDPNIAGGSVHVLCPASDPVCFRVRDIIGTDKQNAAPVKLKRKQTV